jgi:subtilase family serine protease
VQSSRLGVIGITGLAGVGLLALAACSTSSGGQAGQAGPAGGAGVTHSATLVPAAPSGAAPSGAAPSGAAPPRLDGGLTPAQLRAAYGTGPLLRRGIDGRGQTIVIIDPFGSPTIQHDLGVFDQAFGLPAPPSFRVIQPAGPVPPFRATPERTGAAGETTLDIESAHLIAPGARLLLVETPTAENEGATGFPQIVTAEDYVIRHHLGGVISQSFGATEQTFASPAALRQLRGPYLLAARPAYRVTVLAATGDLGSAGENYQMTGVLPYPAVGWPATDPLVTAVGGTELNLTASGARQEPDMAWPQGGGGRSAVFARPSYQQGVAGVAGPHRSIPDISMTGSCRSGLEAYGITGASSSATPGWFVACGTSLSTPLFAGIVALADQEAGHPLGLINPALYRMAAAHDRGITDVLRGDNTYRSSSGEIAGFAARAGYDLATGLGTVDAAYFVPELAGLAG